MLELRKTLTSRARLGWPGGREGTSEDGAGRSGGGANSGDEQAGGNTEEDDDEDQAVRVLSRGGAESAAEVDPDFERELGELMREHQGGAAAAAAPAPSALQVRAMELHNT